MPVLRLGVLVLPILAGGLLWAFHRNDLPLISRFRHAPATSPSMPSDARPIDAAATTSASASTDAIVLSKLPLSSIPALTTSVDPDPVASFRRLITPPPGTAQAAPRIDPRLLRKIVDRGVIAYASSTSDAARAKGASLIQIAALVGYPPARSLLARNYPQSAAVRLSVPANDAIRYALDFLKDSAAGTDDSEPVFLALAKHFGLEGQLDSFAAQILASVRGDSQPGLSHRIDTLLELLAQVRGGCVALARLVAGAEGLAEPACSPALGDKLRKHIETVAPVDPEEEARRRGLALLNELDIH